MMMLVDDVRERPARQHLHEYGHAPSCVPLPACAFGVATVGRSDGTVGILAMPHADLPEQRLRTRFSFSIVERAS